MFFFKRKMATDFDYWSTVECADFIKQMVSNKRTSRTSAQLKDHLTIDDEVEGSTKWPPMATYISTESKNYLNFYPSTVQHAYLGRFYLFSKKEDTCHAVGHTFCFKRMGEIEMKTDDIGTWKNNFFSPRPIWKMSQQPKQISKNIRKKRTITRFGFLSTSANSRPLKCSPSPKSLTKLSQRYYQDGGNHHWSFPMEIS